MPGFVLDASAILAVFYREPGADQIESLLPHAKVSAVNWSEVAAKLVDRGTTPDRVVMLLDDLRTQVVPFDRAQATCAGALRAATRSAGLSNADRACLALALRDGAIAMTADRAWSGIADAVGVEVRLIR